MPRHTTALFVATLILSPTALLSQEKPDEKPTEPIYVLEKFVTEGKVEDPNYILPNTPSASSFGFSKPLLETPRSVSYISAEQLSLLGISTVEDVSRAVPGTYTTMRFGLQGGINVRGVQSDTYFRGMKRLNQQGHSRTTFAAMDSMEIVKGPPSPIYGMGKIGGYTNYNPKSGRAKLGTYLEKEEGFAQVVVGSYDRAEASVGVGGPLSPGGKKGGYYLYSLLENSGTFIKRVDAEQRFLQGSVSINDFIGKFRLESGGQFQNSITSGAFMTRVTQDLIDTGRYVRGMPLANLDLDGDGKISYLETVQGSQVRGNLSAANQPLSQRFVWPRDSSGNLLSLEDFPKVPGIPKAMYDYLVAHPEADPTGLLRAQGVGGPLPQSGQLPLGFVLDPRTVGYDTVDIRRPGGFEREQNAKIYLAYLDLIYDSDPDLTIKNQSFFDKLDQYKVSEMPFAEQQLIFAAENKTTITKRFKGLPAWLEINSLASLNHRYTNVRQRSGSSGSTGDLVHRNDVMLGEGLLTPNTRFWNFIDNAALAPFSADRHSKQSDTGLGLMFDVDLFEKTNLIVGGRYDISEARHTDYRAFNGASGTTANPGTYTSAVTAKGFDKGPSYSISLSHQLPYGMRPYFTYAKSSLSLAGENEGLAINTVQAGHIGQAEIKEAGLKASWLKDRLFFTVAAYEQTRSDVSRPDDPTAGAAVTSTETRGVEVELKWVPSKKFSISGYGLAQHAEYTVDIATNVDISARLLGFMDVIDPVTGAVIYPAEAFLYGGIAAVVLPANVPEYRRRLGEPQTQFGLNANYRFDSGFGILIGGTYAPKFYADRLKALTLPEALVLNPGLSWENARWQIRLNVFNATDERYFRPRNRDFDPERVSAMPGRRWELTVKTTF